MNEPIITPDENEENQLKTPQKDENVTVELDYQKIKKISEIPHKGISQPNSNTFYISTGCLNKCIPLILFFWKWNCNAPYFNSRI